MSRIQQEVTLGAPPARVYQALVEPKRFCEVTGAPAMGEGAEGAAFAVFGGHVSGRHLELVPGRLLVQAWRAKTWPEGVYSIARFELQSSGAGTKVVFEHSGFPEDMKDHLAKGWQMNYWDKLSALA